MHLDVQQQTITITVDTANPASLLVYARFEEAQTNFLSINDMLDYDDVTSSIQTDQTPKGTWLKGSVVSDTTSDVRGALASLSHLPCD